MSCDWWESSSALPKKEGEDFRASWEWKEWEISSGVMIHLASPLLTVLSCWSYPISSIARMLIMWIPFSSAGRQEYFLFTLIPVSSGASLRSSGRKSTPWNSLSVSENKRNNFTKTLWIPTLAPPRATPSCNLSCSCHLLPRSPWAELPPLSRSLLI